MLNGHLIELKTQFLANLEKNFLSGGCYSTVPLSMFVNMVKTAVIFEARSKPTVHHIGTHTVSTKGSGSSSRRLTACVSAACDGTKLALFLIFKWNPNGHIEIQLETLLTQNIFGCCEDKGMMDLGSIKTRAEKVLQSYVYAYGQSVLLLDCFACHKHPALLHALKDIETSVELISGG